MKYLKIHGLEAGQWYDRDEILLQAAFQILVDFIEKEKPGEVIDWSSDEHHQHAWSEMQSLYKWWKEERPARIDPVMDESLEVPELTFKEATPGENPNIAPRTKVWDPQKEKYATFWKACEESSRLEKIWDEEDQKNLHRLIEIRKDLWT